MTFDLEKARASITHYQIENPDNVDTTTSALKELVDQANLAEEMLAEIERLRETHEVLEKILGTDDTLENVARRAVNRIAELEVVLVEERAKTIMLIEKLKSVANDPDWQSKGLEHDFDWYMAESKKQIESGEPEDEAAIHKKMEELPSAPGAYRPAIREEAIRQLNTMRSWQITEEATR